MNTPEPEFDQFAEEYNQILEKSTRLAGESSLFFAEQKIQLMARITPAEAPQGAVLDYGCGTGNACPLVKSYFPGWIYHGVDVSPKSIATGVEKNTPDDHFAVLDESGLAYPDATFDRIFSSVVFHHIPHDQHRRCVADIVRALKPGGWFFIFEHNPLSLATQYVVKNCPFDDDAVLLKSWYTRRLFREAGLLDVQQKYYLFFPAFLKAFRPLEALLGWCPLGAQYLVCGRKPGP